MPGKFLEFPMVRWYLVVLWPERTLTLLFGSEGAGAGHRKDLGKPALLVLPVETDPLPCLGKVETFTEDLGME